MNSIYNIRKEANGFTVQPFQAYGITACEIDTHIFYTLKEAIDFIASKFNIGIEERPCIHQSE